MLGINNLRVGTTFTMEGAPYLVLEAKHLKMAQRRAVLQTKIKNLISGSVYTRNFSQSDEFKDAEIEKKPIKFLYQHRGKFVFGDINDPKTRFELNEDLIGEGAQFLKPNLELAAFYFENKIISLELPIKVELKVIEAPPAVRGNTVQGGTKTVILESGAKIQTPLFVKEGDIIVVNTASGQYVERFG